MWMGELKHLKIAGPGISRGGGAKLLAGPAQVFLFFFKGCTPPGLPTYLDLCALVIKLKVWLGGLCTALQHGYQEL